MMIRLVIARHDDSVYKEYLEPSVNMLDVTTHEVRDNELSLSLTKKYNIGIEDVLQDDTFSDNDIIVFIHEDVKIKDQFFTEKLNMVFSNNNKIGLVGVIGCNEFTSNGMWWANTPNKLNGHIIQENDSTVQHLIKGNLGFYDNTVAIDGLMFAIKGKLLKDGLRFDESFSFHHYDIDICFQVRQMKYIVAIADILLQHKSSGLGSLTDDYKKSKDILLNKWSKEYEFPITAKSF